MVSDDRDPDGTGRVERRLEPAQALAAAARERRPAAAGAGLPERVPRLVPRRAAQRGGEARTADGDGSAPSAPAARPPKGAAQRGPHTLARPRHATTGAALAQDGVP